jgi:hypothetical protein
VREHPQAEATAPRSVLIRNFFTPRTTIRNFANISESGLGESSGRSWQHGGTAQAYVRARYLFVMRALVLSRKAALCEWRDKLALLTSPRLS